MKKIAKKVLVATTLAATFTIGMSVNHAVHIEATAKEQVQVETAYTNQVVITREQETTASAPVLYLQPGTPVKVLSHKNEWVEVASNVKTSWVHENVLSTKKVKAQRGILLDLSFIERLAQAESNAISVDKNALATISVKASDASTKTYAVVQNKKGKTVTKLSLTPGKVQKLPLGVAKGSYTVSIFTAPKGTQIENGKLLATTNVKITTTADDVQRYKATNDFIVGSVHDYTFYLLNSELANANDLTDEEKVSAVVSTLISNVKQRVVQSESDLSTKVHVATAENEYGNIMATGIATEYQVSILAAGLLRELGVPTRVVQGVSVFDKNYITTWNEVYVGDKWQVLSLTGLLDFEGNVPNYNTLSLDEKDILRENAYATAKKYY